MLLVGWRFVVAASCGATLKRFGLKLRQAEVSNGSISGVIMRVPPNGTSPVDPADAPADVLATAVMALRPHNDGPQIVAATVNLPLEPGTYQMVFGTGKHGTSPTQANVFSTSASACANGQFPFTINTQTHLPSLQGATPHFFVELVDG